MTSVESLCLESGNGLSDFWVFLYFVRGRADFVLCRVRGKVV